MELGPFTDGVNLVDPPTKLSLKELSRCLNWRMGVRGEFYKRPGHGNYGSAPAKINGDNLVNLLVRYYKADGTKQLIAAAGGKLRLGNDSTGAWVDIPIDGNPANNMEATKLVDWIVYKDRLYIADGVKPQRWNTVDNIYAGHFVHAAPTLAPGTAGSLTPSSTYKYFVTSVAGDMGEGPKGAEASIVLGAGQDEVDLSAMAAAPAKHGETFKRIYRTKANGSLFYFLAEIPSATTISNDILADTALGEEFIPTVIPPANARFVIIGHDERAYWFGMSGVDASLVRVSEVGFPDRIVNNGSDGFFTVANNDGDIITGGGLTPGGIVFFKRSSIWLSRGYGYGLINIQPKDKRGPGVGSVAPFSIVSTPIGLIFLSQRGEIYLFDGTNTYEIGRTVASEFADMPTLSMARIVAGYHDYRYILHYDYKGSKGYNWKTLEYDTIGKKWEGPHENGLFYTPSYLSIWDSELDKGELAWGEARAATGSYVYIRSKTTKTDRGNKFRSDARTGALPLARLGDVVTTKLVVNAEVSADVALTASHIDKQGVKDSVELTTPISFTASKLGGTDSLGGPGAVLPLFKLGGRYEDILEGSFGPAARSRTPMYEISDNGTATEVRINVMELLAETLPVG